MLFSKFFKKAPVKRITVDADLLIRNPSPAFAETLRSARTNLMYSLANIEGGKCFLVTSSLAAEGKTSTCINLAISLAQTGVRVLLVDADLRRPKVHTYLNIKNGKGLANYLAGFCGLDEAVQRIDSLNLDCMTSGDLPPNPAELLSSKRTKEFISAAKESYDYIVIDTPPVNLATDAPVLTQVVENVMFVCKCGASYIAEIKKALGALKFANAKILGFIAIEAPGKHRKTRRYSRYYRYYGYKEY